MPYKEKEIEKRYYTIGEVANKFDVATSLIRFWEGEFDSIKPRKNRKGNRQFTIEDIRTIKLIFHLVKEKGYTLQGARDYIASEKKSTHDNFANSKEISNSEMLKTFEDLREFLIKVRNTLD